MSGRVKVLLVKEWVEFASRRWLMLSTLVVPLMFLIVVPFGLGFGLSAALGEKALNDPDMDKLYHIMRSTAPGLAEASAEDLFRVFLLRQCIVLSLFVPVVATMTIATYSIVGEKVNRSLEPLLATPLTTMELLLGKALAAAIPAVGVTWGFFAIYALAIRAFVTSEVYSQVINATALLIVFLVGPLLAVLTLSLAIIASSRSSDPRSAQQIVVIVLLPLVGVIIGQVAGLLMLTPLLVLAGAIALAIIDFFVLAVGAALFERENILTRWK
ncbi:MAG TPA: ABC transporter permease subunit [Blastocatellia bacterium]|nr:ABC transporter permease subunit [Blastocatellia bacterium]